MDVIKEFPGKIKNPFDGGKDDGRNPNIPRRIKLPADDKPRKYIRKDSENKQEEKELIQLDLIKKQLLKKICEIRINY